MLLCLFIKGFKLTKVVFFSYIEYTFETYKGDKILRYFNFFILLINKFHIFSLI